MRATAIIVKLSAMLLIMTQLLALVAADFVGVVLSDVTLKALSTASTAASGALFAAAISTSSRKP